MGGLGAPNVWFLVLESRPMSIAEKPKEFVHGIEAAHNHEGRIITLNNEANDSFEVVTTPTDLPYEVHWANVDEPFQFASEIQDVAIGAWNEHQQRYSAYSHGDGLLTIHSNGTHRLFVRPASYMNLVASMNNQVRELVTQKSGRVVEALAVDGYVVTSDGQLVCCQRSGSVDKPGIMCGIGGYVERAEFEEINDPIGVLPTTLAREAQEELGIKSEWIEGITQLSMTKINRGVIQSVGHLIHVNVTAEQVYRSFQGVYQASKHPEVAGIDTWTLNPESLIQLAYLYRHQALTSSLGTLYALGKYMFGEKAGEAMEREMVR